MTEQPTLTDYDKRRQHFNHVRAQAVRWINEHPGITCNELKLRFAEQWKHVPEVQNRLREAEQAGWIEARKHETDSLLHYYPKEEEKFEGEGERAQ